MGVNIRSRSTRKTPLTAANVLNDRVIPFFDKHELRGNRILTDRGTEYCGAHDRHELYLAVENIDHTRTKVKSPQTNGSCERFNKTLLGELYRVAFRKKVYDTIEALQLDSMRGSRSITSSARTRAAGVSERHRCKPFSTPIL